MKQISAGCWLLLTFWAGAEVTEPVKTLQTPGGVRFAMVGEKGETPAPTLFVMAIGAAETLQHDDFFKSGRLLRRQEWLCVSLDVPCHGDDVRTGEPPELKGWRARLDQKDNFVVGFTRKCSDVLDYLVKEGYTDSNRIAVAGTSRGGLCALHFTASEPRVKWLMAFAPVTDLPVLEEFKGLENNAMPQSLAPANLAEKLVGREIWLCIGNNDARVGTDECFTFVRRVAQANLKAGRPAMIELHVMPSVGHTIHDSAHDEAAAWLSEKSK